MFINSIFGQLPHVGWKILNKVNFFFARLCIPTKHCCFATVQVSKFKNSVIMRGWSLPERWRHCLLEQRCVTWRSVCKHGNQWWWSRESLWVALWIWLYREWQSTPSQILKYNLVDRLWKHPASCLQCKRWSISCQTIPSSLENASSFSVRANLTERKNEKKKAYNFWMIVPLMKMNIKGAF